MTEEIKKIPCDVCKKEIPFATALRAEGRDYILYFCSPGCLDEWKKEKDIPIEKKDVPK
jgi:hypothetical protein